MTEYVAGVLAVYGALLAFGGWMGQRKAGSRISLIAGLLTGLAAIVAAGMTLVPVTSMAGRVLGLLTAIALAGLFGLRFARTRKVMPAGMMGLLSLIVAGFVGVSFAMN
jgi:uncharacterized membrane protein (UPF0136 family)